jgi:hypothetical protein
MGIAYRQKPPQWAAVALSFDVYDNSSIYRGALVIRAKVQLFSTKVGLSLPLETQQQRLGWAIPS